ncbi:hypothetical protein GURKE_02240 [Brevundimonas phage vB_BpoS-Gurke]|uniref:Uncharacterized protein n=1 Tax=Brevundimonas phage vB_BpoS-Gurke TaxID=2948599 RepID=A0A9E7N3L8_9CAUD|nr:hypothetical protein GURKE_02240 [Brevundimonas phage vB_BpoS-Gurke]
MSRWFLALAAWGVTAIPALAGDPERCAYREERLAQACAERPEIRRYLLEPFNVQVERYRDIPPAVRGWDPGEQDQVFAIALEHAEQVKAGCGFDDLAFARACMLDYDLRQAAHAARLPASASWFHLPFDVAGWAPQSFDRRRLSDHPGAREQRMRWIFTGSSEERVAELEGAIGRAIRQRVQLAHAYLVAVDGRNYVACGYGFFDGGGYEDPSAGLVVFDTQGGSAIRAPRDLFNGLCGVSDVVLR